MEFCCHYVHNPNFLWASLQLRGHTLGEVMKVIYLYISTQNVSNIDFTTYVQDENYVLLSEPNTSELKCDFRLLT